MVPQVRLIAAAVLVTAALVSCETLLKPVGPPPPGAPTPPPVVDPTPEDPLDQGDLVIAKTQEAANDLGLGPVVGGALALLAALYGAYKVGKRNNASAQGGGVQTP